MTENLAIPKNTIEIIQKHNFVFRKQFGQNFLIDPRVLERIVESSGVGPEDCVLEIGPGIGTMTRKLAEYAKKVIAVEIDDNLIPILQETLADLPNVELIHNDIMKVDIRKLCEEQNEGKPIHVVANLPYYITTPIIMGLFESGVPLRNVTVMVQKEVADRLSAKVGSEDYSALSIEVQYLYDVKLEMNISRFVFYPMPNVDSAVISFTPKRERDREFEEKFFELVKNCFRMRRKTLYNNLKDLYDAQKLEEVYVRTGLRRNIRAQQLTLDDFLKLNEVIAE